MPDPQQRAAFLAAACHGDGALRQRVEELLSLQTEADAQYDEAAREPRAVVNALAPGGVIPPAANEKTGDRIGPYKLLEQIGTGGMGAVWMAEQTEPIRRRVALKVIKQGLDTGQVMARFEAERQALALMDHPNIAKVLDAGSTAEGRPFFVMELVKGIPLTRFCDEQRLSIRQRLELFMPVCQAIQHAHQKGVIHRDIKPSNVLVALYDARPVPKVIDFGIAKATGQQLTEKTLFTSFGAVVGTLEYMSPEQAELNQIDIDTRSDIYSLGVLLYELLTGSTPLTRESLPQAAFDEVLRRIREEEPPRPSTRLSDSKERLAILSAQRRLEPAHLAKLVRGDLDWIAMKCLEKDRNRRYETATSLAADIQRHLHDEPVIACAPSAAYKFRKFAQRNKIALAAVTAIAVMLLGATAVSSWLAVRAMRAETLAAQRLTESEDVAKFLRDVFRSPDPERDGRTITMAEALTASAKRLEKDLPTQPVVRAKLQATIGQTYVGLGLYRESIPLLEKARDYFLESGEFENTNYLRSINLLAASYKAVDRTNEGISLLEQAMTLARTLSGAEHVSTLAVMCNLGNAYAWGGRRDEGLKLLEQSFSLYRKVNGLENSDTLRAMQCLADCYNVGGRRDEALKLREQGLELVRKVNGPEHPDMAIAMESLAISYADAGRRAEAIQLREQSVQLSRKVIGVEHQRTLRTMGNLAECYHDEGRREDLRKLAEEMLPACRKVFGPTHKLAEWRKKLDQLPPDPTPAF